MKLKHILILTIGGMLSSCSISKQQIYWVNSTKATCDAGAGKMQCLQVSKNQDLNKAEWQFFMPQSKILSLRKDFSKKYKYKKPN